MQNVIDSGYFNRYASCPDTVRFYESYSGENQKLWVEKSEAIIQEYVKNLSTFKSFREAYTFLAKRRHEIAMQLKQRNEEGHSDLYGSFRGEGDHFRKAISAGEGEPFWKWQKKKIFELTYQLIEPIKQDKNFYEDKVVRCLRERVAVDDAYATYYCVSVKSPYYNIDQEIGSTIELFDFDHHKESNSIRIEYTPLNTDNVDAYYAVADAEYQRLLNWKSHEGLQSFFVSAGRLAYLLAHLLLVKHGNVAITEWMLRGIAFHHRINLSYFNQAENISWDFKAVLTPQLEKYIDWFYEKAFQGYRMLDADESINFAFR